MAIELFWSSGSAYSWRALLALEWKRIPYESHLLSFSKGENKTPSFLAMNPRGRVPVLRDGDIVIYESLAIVTYLDRVAPARPLFGETPADAARIMTVVSECLSDFDPQAEAFALPLYFGKATEQAEAVATAARALAAELPRFEARLASTPWLAGHELTAADIILFPMIQQVLRAAGKPAAQAFDLSFLPFDHHTPNLAAWMKRVEALPGYERTYPPHWR